VERQTRFIMLCRLDGSRLAEHVKDALAKKILELPEPASVADLGSGQGDGRTCSFHARHRCAGVLLRSTQPMAARDQ
jgi:hypothetical protein